MSLTVNDIQKQFEQRTLKRLEIYKKILNRCFKNIRGKSKDGSGNLFYKVPLIYIGQPLYKMDLCIEYLLYKLEQGGFKCSRIPKTNILYISWEIKKPKLQQLEYKVDTSSYKPKKVIYDEPKPIIPQRSVYSYKPSGRFT